MRKFWGSLVCIAALMLFLSVALLPTNNDAIAAASTNMPGAAQSAPTTQTVLVAQSALLTTVAKRLEQLNNVTVTFIEDDDYTPFDVPQADAAMKILVAKYHLHLGPVIRGHRIFDCLFSYLDGRARYENTMTPWTIAKLAATIGESFIGDFKTIQTFAPECVENLHYEPNVKFPLGSIQAEAPLPWSTIDVALGLRVSGTSVSWLRPEDIMRMIVKQEMNGDFTLQQVVGTYKYLWTFQRNPNLELVAFNASY
ncbi:MAG TPA: hypothetical protein VMG59_01385, partial [Phycisphaerae bacterium]|nr:hypothetical protein [Phycisphaerae bacterium]